MSSGVNLFFDVTPSHPASDGVLGNTGRAPLALMVQQLLLLMIASTVPRGGDPAAAGISAVGGGGGGGFQPIQFSSPPPPLQGAVAGFELNPHSMLSRVVAYFLRSVRPWVCC
eukprot:TRINITY_DN21938_c0_g1_i1.p2 TRINITY_DN21938_c0_g1~~TRINITY_DN21938_c0_g1_i1.p2  ORF type:complete len:113 (+),score=14.11 TRINITY_DN21938_c0_g1_i1:610-948(+)